ncbi:hypothetical protein [Embleya scabrispora]|nr:hypothetical protein [Embleya scabrispora]
MAERIDRLVRQAVVLARERGTSREEIADAAHVGPGVLARTPAAK